MQPQTWNPDRTAVAVIRGIRHMLQIEAGEQAGNQPCAVVDLSDRLRAVTQAAIAEEEIVASASEIIGMHSGDTRGGELRAHCIVRTMPAASGDRSPNRRQLIDGGESEA